LDVVRGSHNKTEVKENWNIGETKEIGMMEYWVIRRKHRTNGTQEITKRKEQ